LEGQRNEVYSGEADNVIYSRRPFDNREGSGTLNFKSETLDPEGVASGRYTEEWRTRRCFTALIRGSAA